MNPLRLFRRERKAPPSLDWAELYQQAGENVRYLKAHIKVLDSRIEDLKNRSARNSRDKISRLMETRSWMETKLREEEFDLHRFKQKLAPILRSRE